MSRVTLGDHEFDPLDQVDIVADLRVENQDLSEQVVGLREELTDS
jgi:hypothetical protein